jgi:CheY-like chemotaxis protein
MSRILLADDSPHAQRMGERILREEGFEVVTVTDGETALIRLADVDPDLVMADVLLPEKSGYEVCEYVKSRPQFRHVRVVLLAGLLEPVDEAASQRVKADAIIKKPFEASAVMATLRPLVAAALADRTGSAAPPLKITGNILGLNMPPLPRPVRAEAAAAAPAPARIRDRQPAPVEIDTERVRAAVTVALDKAMPALIDEITARVLVALGK